MINLLNLLNSIIKINFPLCPAVGLLGKCIDEVTSKELQYMLDLAFLSVKRTILINWKVRKFNCFNIDCWLKDYLELISMEQAASVLQDLGSDHTNLLSQIMSLLNKKQKDEDTP